jgi:hypothetical protein
VEVVQHVLEICLFTNLDLLSAILHFSVDFERKLILVNMIKDIKFFPHAHLNVSFLAKQFLEINITYGFWIDQLEILSQSKTYVLIQVVLYRRHKVRLEVPKRCRWLILVPGTNHHL